MEDIKSENIWLMKGDCLERMKEIESESIDLTVTSPPYDNLRSPLQHTKGTVCPRQGKRGHGTCHRL